MSAGPGSTLTLDQAYQAAYVWMFHVGEPPSEISERGPQAVELRSSGMASFVRVPENPINQRTVLAVLASEPPGKKRLIFSTTGFTHTAISIAESQGISLFTFEADGSAMPANGPAAAIAPDDAPPAPFTPNNPDDELAITAANWGTTEFPDDEWIDCPGCGVNQHISLDVCRLCGTPLSEQSSPEPPPDEHIYRCRECGSHNVEVTAAADGSARQR